MTGTQVSGNVRLYGRVLQTPTTYRIDELLRVGMKRRVLRSSLSMEKVQLLVEPRALLLELRVHLLHILLGSAVAREHRQQDPCGLVNFDEIGLDLIPVGGVLDIPNQLGVDVFGERADRVDQLLVLAMDVLELVVELN